MDCTNDGTRPTPIPKPIPMAYRMTAGFFGQSAPESATQTKRMALRYR
jgi:hypothetical protein